MDWTRIADTINMTPPQQGAAGKNNEEGMKTMTAITYTTQGNVRGCCGHKHKTIEAAKRCADRDQAGCASQGGYSDRSVVRHDGSELSDDEQNTLEYLCQW